MKPGLPLAILVAGALAARAQVYTKPANSTGSTESTTSSTSSTDTSSASSGDKKSDSPFGNEIPMLDPSAETITVGGVKIPLGDNRLLKARFEKYLSQPPEDSDEAVQYRETIAEILASVSPHRQGGPVLADAFKLLPSASTFPGDANLCGTLAEAVYTAMLAKRDVRGLQNLNETLEEEKKSIIREADFMARHDDQSTLVGPRDKNGRAQRTQKPGTGILSLRYANTVRRITEIEALKKAQIAKTEAEVIRTKTQYQVNLTQWFLQRRYEHVLMGCRFYNQIWQDGDATLRMKKDSDVSKLFSESAGMSPTVSTLDSLANEAIRETTTYIDAFNLMLDRGEIHNASQRLMEAFALGEYLAPILTLPLERKQKVASYVHNLSELSNCLQAHDFTKAKTLAAELKAQADDFPSAKVDSAIAGFTLASDLAIESAKSYVLAKQDDKATEKIKEAAEAWPTNPKLDEFRNLVGNSSAIIMARNDFDRLVNEGNYREILRRQYEIAPSIQGDPTRMEAFSQIIANLTKIETALSKAEEFSRQGQNYSAWEQLAELRADFPDDPKLGRQLEQLAPKVADFTKALDQADQFESKGNQTGSALAWYLKARNIYPQSRIAESAIRRISDTILSPDN